MKRQKTDLQMQRKEAFYSTVPILETLKKAKDKETKEHDVICKASLVTKQIKHVCCIFMCFYSIRFH